jgi:hypothetical protein
MIKKIVFGGLFAVLASTASAQHAHSDVDAYIENSQFLFEGASILVNGSGYLTSNIGSALYEVEFGAEFGDAANETEDPGFAIDDGSFNAGDYLAFEAVNTLSYWNGTSWSASTAGSESLFITDVSGTATTTVSDNTITNAIGLIDQADAEGGVHAHLDFEIDLAASPGAYLLELVLLGFSDSALTNEIVPASDSFYIAFNYGMDDALFETGIDALGVSEVPLPGAWLFLTSGIGMLLLGRRAKA